MQNTPPHHPYAGRMQRLLVLINEVKTNPRQIPTALYTALGLSHAMISKDRKALGHLGGDSQRADCNL